MKKLLINWNDYKFVIFAEKNDNDIVDDYIETINNNLEEPINFIKIYDIHPNSKDYEDLFYMSSCHHFIIANSSYSWFGAYFSDNNNKQVLYPCKWFGVNHSNYNTNDIPMNDWIKIDF